MGQHAGNVRSDWHSVFFLGGGDGHSGVQGFDNGPQAVISTAPRSEGIHGVRTVGGT